MLSWGQGRVQRFGFLGFGVLGGSGVESGELLKRRLEVLQVVAVVWGCGFRV